jgi:excinuclease ABC subunit C
VGDPASYRPQTGSVPESAGVYRFSDEHGRVLYVGKAKSLRSRLASYFADLHSLHPRTQTMLRAAAALDWVVVANEVEALALEYTWIKEFEPRFNVRYRDDKSYPSLAVTLDEEYPRLSVLRGPRRKGVRYFGPYAHAWAIRETLDLLLRVFPARTCSAGVFRRAAAAGRPCLLGYIGKCSAPCVGRVSAAEHRRIALDFCDFMSGATAPFIRRLEREMNQAAAEQAYERAARLRDDLTALRRAMESQAVVLADGTDADVVAFAEDALEAAVQVFYVRGGRVRGQRGWVVDRVEDLDTGGLVEQFLTQAYLDEAGEVPREVLVPALPPESEAVVKLLETARGARVDLRVPRRGDKRALMSTVQRNAAEALARHKLRRASDLTARSAALAELQEVLGLPTAPLRIECFDVSNLQGTDSVASMVVFEDGLARKSAYRRFAVRDARDDASALREVIGRRLRRFAEESEAPVEAGAPRRFAYPPNLLVVDGGAPQVAAAAAAVRESGIRDVAVVGLAKRLEEVWLPADPDPVILPRTSEALYLLQRVRDEAHRFAIAYHRLRRSRSMKASALDAVPGLGETRRRALLRHFGSVRRLREASVEEIAAVPGVGPRTASAVRAALSARPAAVSADPLTGEIVESIGGAR